MRRLKLALVAALLGTGLLAAFNTSATVVLALKFDELVRMADGVVLGTVESVISRRDERKHIATYVTLTDLDLLTGSYQGKTLTLRFAGGTAENEIVEVEGSPTFHAKERVILFVSGNGEQLVPVLGWGQGVFRVVRDPQGGPEVISDSVGNRVFGIRDGQVVKERRVASELELFGPRMGGPSEATPPKGGLGRTETGEQIGPPRTNDIQGSRAGDETRTLAESGEVMRLDQFVADVRRTAETAGIQGKPLRSVAEGQALAVSDKDAAPREVTTTEPARQAPPERGEFPRPIERGTTDPSLR
ncbi:MAG: hypothetical protein HY852_19280 [Bradyrhizobium sp.]|uniref:hypothetical protein n=1 Tax=Bradyrhizobium sp. TaxID=376 RepID=UPI0025C6927F|nr:hypothetical protein [Bradyrhizobium sp.]MBI5263956.1 hypothetical protein [Bradyrhizobium sp.]